MEKDKKTEEEIDSLQELFGRALLQVSQSTLKLSFRAALGLLGSRWRIWESKVLLVLALKGQEKGCLAQEVMKEQMRMGWPGLGQEVKQIKVTQSDSKSKKILLKRLIITQRNLKWLKVT